MAKELFDYKNIKSSEYSYYGFHLKDGQYHIDTERIKKLGFQNVFPEQLFSLPKNNHYFIPKHKNISDYAVSLLRECVNKLSSDWNQEYKQVIAKLTTPKEVFEQTRVAELMFTSSAENLDEIDVDAMLTAAKRYKQYGEVIKSIHLQYLQKTFIEYFRAIYLVIKDRGYSNTNDFSYGDFLSYVQEKTGTKTKKLNPLYRLPHYKYLHVLNKIDNFLKHNTKKSYLSLANNPCEKDLDLKAFQASFVFSEEEAGYPYESGMYAGNWLKINSSFVDETLANLREFSNEFCQTVFGEDPSESYWNSDEALLQILKDRFFAFR